MKSVVHIGSMENSREVSLLEKINNSKTMQKNFFLKEYIQNSFEEFSVISYCENEDFYKI